MPRPRRSFPADFKAKIVLELLTGAKPTRRTRTTDSNHAFPRYPNLVADLQITRPDQVWVADITYIRLRNEFVYLAVRWALSSRRRCRANRRDASASAATCCCHAAMLLAVTLADAVAAAADRRSKKPAALRPWACGVGEYYGAFRSGLRFRFGLVLGWTLRCLALRHQPRREQ